MRASDVSQIPVMNNDKLMGILDEEDLLFTVSKDQSSFSNNVSDCMMDKLDTLQFDASKDELLSFKSNIFLLYCLIWMKLLFFGFIFWFIF